MKEDTKEYVFCGEQTRKAISCDCGIFYFKDDVIKLLASQKQEILETIQKDLVKGKFYQICSNETTFMDYLKQLTLKI